MLRNVIKGVIIRAVAIELTAVMDTSAGWLTMPFEAVNSIRDVKPHLGMTARALVATIANVGMVDSFVAEVAVYVPPDGKDTGTPQFNPLPGPALCMPL